MVTASVRKENLDFRLKLTVEAEPGYGKFANCLSSFFCLEDSLDGNVEADVEADV